MTERTKVFVAIGWWHHEGYDDPIGIFTSRERAQASLINLGDKHYSGIDILEYEVNGKRTDGEQVERNEKHRAP